MGGRLRLLEELHHPWTQTEPFDPWESITHPGTPGTRLCVTERAAPILFAQKLVNHAY